MKANESNKVMMRRLMVIHADAEHQEAFKKNENENMFTREQIEINITCNAQANLL